MGHASHGIQGMSAVKVSSEMKGSCLYLAKGGLLYVDTVVLGLLLCLYIHTCNVLYL